MTGKHGNLHHEKLSRALICVTAVPIFLAILFYVTYSAKAWFFQDDFRFIFLYSDRLRIGELAEFSNFGRFVSRNLYWHFGWRIFGSHSEFYFLLNFLIIACTSWVLYLVFALRQDRYSGMVAAAIYLCLPPVMSAYTWLSYSQHLLGHLFVLLFVWCYLRSRKEGPGSLSLGRAVLLSGVLCCGLLSNAFVGAVLSLPLVTAALNQPIRQSRSHWIWLGFATTGFGIFSYQMTKWAVGAYATDFSWAVVNQNLEFYFKHIGIAILWLVMTIFGAILALRGRDIFGFWLFIASPAFLLPFIFLTHQRYIEYGALAYLFFILGCWSRVWEHMKSRQWLSSIYFAGAFLALALLLASSMKPIQKALAHPKGWAQLRQVEDLRDLTNSHPNAKRICFRADNQEAQSDVEVWNIPTEWWGVGFGEAFSIFVDPGKSYRLLSENEEDADILRSVVGSSQISSCQSTFNLWSDSIRPS